MVCARTVLRLYSRVRASVCVAFESRKPRLQPTHELHNSRSGNTVPSRAIHSLKCTSIDVECIMPMQCDRPFHTCTNTPPTPFEPEPRRKHASAHTATERTQSRTLRHQHLHRHVATHSHAPECAVVQRSLAHSASNNDKQCQGKRAHTLTHSLEHWDELAAARALHVRNILMRSFEYWRDPLAIA